MKKSGSDPLGYYGTLGVPPGASADEVKSAYRRRASELHPDKNPDRNTTAAFQVLAAAYEVLSDPQKRAQYDSTGREIPEQESEAAAEPPEPIFCSSCGVLTAQPRYVIFLKVVSVIFMTTKSTIQGVFCHRCALKKGLGAAITTWLAGWWGFPFGPIYSVEAIFKNLFGGQRPDDVNARLLSYQAWWFARAGKVDIARAIAVDALALASKAKDAKLMGLMGSLLQETDDGKPIPQFKQRWGAFGSPFAAQLTVAIAVIGGIWTAAKWDEIKSNAEWEKLVEARTAARTQSPFRDPDSVPEKPRASFRPTAPVETVPPPNPRLEALPIPANGDFRRYWSGHVALLAPFRVVTPSGGDHYFVKLVDAGNRPIITFFVRGGSAAEVEVPLGSYRMKYASGEVWFGEDALFGPNTSYSEASTTMVFHREGDRVAGHSVELIKRTGGNLRTTSIAPTQF